MVYQIYYELASAGFILATLLAFYRQKHLDICRNTFFKALLILVGQSSVVDVIGGAIISGMFDVSVGWKQLAEVVCLLLHQHCAMIYGIYILAVLRRLEFAYKYRWQLLVPYGLGLICSISSPWTHIMFYFNAHGELCYSRWYLLAYLLILLYVVIPSVLACTMRKQIKTVDVNWICLFSVMLVAGVLLQYFVFKGVLISYMMNCLVVFACYLFLQNSDYYLDEETGLFKRHGFEEVVKERMIYKKKSSYLLIRIMHYNTMSEMYEDYRLTEVQRRMAQIMQTECRDYTFYHIAASTFAVITASPEESERIYQILHEAIPKNWNVEGEEVVHEYSFYTVSTPDECDNTEELLQRISYARSDHPGHHKPGELIHLTHATVELAEEKQMVVDLIEEAIMDNSIELNFQPIYSLEKRRITSLEVLARLKDRNKKYINPEFFIHIAEENRSIIQLGEQIYRKACIFAVQNHIFEMGIDDININLSPVQCCYEGLADDLIRIAGEYEIPMSRMHLEITESDMMDREEIVNTLEALCAAGAKIALDDFGTGYSSMTSISSLPVEYVKIDKSLVWSYGDGKNRYLNQLVPMIHAEGKKIISEGIETQDHIDIFERLNGDFLQGYYYSKPLKEEDFIAYLKEVNGVAEA